MPPSRSCTNLIWKESESDDDSHGTNILYLENPVEGSLFVEHIEPVIRGEPDEAVGEDVPVPDPDPGNLKHDVDSEGS